MSWLSRLIPSRTAMVGALVALFATFLAWLRRDARRDLKQTLKQKDIEHAKELSDRVRTGRADPEQLHKFDDAGWRD